MPVLTASVARARVSLLLAAAGWGLGAVLTKAALTQGVPPLSLLVIQLAVSVAALALLARWQRLHLRLTRPLLGVGLLGLLNPGLAYTLSLLGLAHTTASDSALLWGLEPLLITGLAWLWLRERPGQWFVFLSGVAVVGVALAVRADLSQPGQWAGNALILGGVTTCALYSVLARRASAASQPLLAVTLQQGFALTWALLLWPAEWVPAGLTWTTRVPGTAWALAALSGVVYYGLAFWCYLAALRQVSASQAGAFINLVPVVALASAWALLGEKLAPAQWLGAALTIGAVLLAMASLDFERGRLA